MPLSPPFFQKKLTCSPGEGLVFLSGCATMLDKTTHTGRRRSAYATLHPQRLPAVHPRRPGALPPLWGRPAHFRLSLPFEPPGDPGGPAVRDHHPGVALGGPLQVAAHAGKRGARGAHHRGRGPLREVLSLGPHRGKERGQPPLRLDPHGIEKLLRGGGAAQ